MTRAGRIFVGVIIGLWVRVILWMRVFRCDLEKLQAYLDDPKTKLPTCWVPKPFLPTADNSNPVRPLYFVMDIGGSFVAADPQPPLFPEDWTHAKERDLVIEQSQFLLRQVPMINAPDGNDARLRLECSVTPYAYMHPATFEKITGYNGNVLFLTLGRSMTKWIRTELMPEGLVVFSPNEMPGIRP